MGLEADCIAFPIQRNSQRHRARPRDAVVTLITEREKLAMTGSRKIRVPMIYRGVAICATFVAAILFVTQCATAQQSSNKKSTSTENTKPSADKPATNSTKSNSTR